MCYLLQYLITEFKLSNLPGVLVWYDLMVSTPYRSIAVWVCYDLKFKKCAATLVQQLKELGGAWPKGIFE